MQNSPDSQLAIGAVPSEYDAQTADILRKCSFSKTRHFQQIALDTFWKAFRLYTCSTWNTRMFHALSR